MTFSLVQSTEQGEPVTSSTVLLSVRAGALLSVIAFIVALHAPSPASASSYVVQECHTHNPAVPDVVEEGTATGPRMDDFCAGSRYLRAGAQGAIAAQSFRKWVFQAPPGTRMADVSGIYSMMSSSTPNNQRAYVFAKRPGEPEQVINQSSGAGTGFTGASFELTDFMQSAVQRFGIGIRCANSPGEGNCGSSEGTYAQVGQLNIRMEDTTPPTEPGITGSALTGWHNGTTLASYVVSDQGAGVSAGGTLVNGTGVDLDSYCAPAETSAGHARSMAPCPSFSGGGSSFDVTKTPFKEGDNTLQHCVSEYGNQPQATCASRTIKVDTIPPGSVSDPRVAGGQGWHRDNDFDLNWTNRPDAPNSSPIVGAELRLMGDDGYDVTSWHPGTDIEAIENVKVPAKGAYTAQIYLVDAAGNKTNIFGAISHSVDLKFDNTVPDPQTPSVANGWISRDEAEVGYLQKWGDVPEERVPVSGIAGYRTTISSSPDSDPCSGGSDPRACGGPLTEVGRSSRTRVVFRRDLREGTNHIHVVPVSGSGMRATEIRRTPLRADFTDPVTELHGAGGAQWVNQDVEATVTAQDDLSGMANNDQFPGDAPPMTFLQVDGAPAESAVGASLSHTISEEGEHEVTHWARDLAGNTQQHPTTEIVRIDKTAPRVAFTNSQDPEDPDLLVAPVSDQLSGVTSGSIEYRSRGASDWLALNSSLRAGALVARVDSRKLTLGTLYEFRVAATDAAGNTAVSTKKQNGMPMVVNGSFRGRTEIREFAVNGKQKARIKYGKRARVSGTLARVGGGPIANAPVQLTEDYVVGSETGSRTTTVRTDARGRFQAALPAGPSRMISARYAGSRRDLGTDIAGGKLSVRGKVSLRTPRRVDADRGVVFRGKVGARQALLGRRGKRLEVQVKVGRRWKTVGKSFRSSARGAYRLRYRFTAHYPRAVTYRFRTISLPERGFPYLQAKSKVRRVTVAP